MVNLSVVCVPYLSVFLAGYWDRIVNKTDDIFTHSVCFLYTTIDKNTFVNVWFSQGVILDMIFFKKSIMNPWILLNKYIFVKFEKKTMTRLRFKKLIYPSGFVALIYLGIWHVKRERFCVLDGDKQVKTSSSFSNECRVRLLTKIMNLSLFYRRWKLIKHLSYFQSFW